MRLRDRLLRKSAQRTECKTVNRKQKTNRVPTRDGYSAVKRDIAHGARAGLVFDDSSFLFNGTRMAELKQDADGQMNVENESQTRISPRDDASQSGLNRIYAF